MWWHPIQSRTTTTDMRIVTAEFNVTLDIAIPDHLGAEWVVDKYNFSQRFGVSPLKGDSELWDLYFRRKDCIGRLQPASALTIHKSQGSTFQNVWLHWSIDGWGSAPTAQQNQLAYVGITRAAETLHVVGDR